jgi:conjugal transfer mating pair stabilization protein TraN
MMEARREIGVYSPDGLNIFAGKPMTGTKGYLGLKNCLKTSGGAQSNGSIAKNLGMQAAGAGVMAGAKYGAQVGANVVYDSFFTSGSQAMSGFAQWAGMNAPEAGFGFGGFGTTASGAGGLLGEAGSIALGESGLFFNPYAFAAMVAIQVVMEMTKCTEDEQKLSQMRGANLCQQIGSYCSQELNLGFAKICIETTESFCCFNGLLPLVVNQQGRPQVGKGWGSARSPDCSGFSTAQLTALDWSRIDLSAVVAQMQSNFNTPSASQFSGAAVGNMQTRGQAK